MAMFKKLRTRIMLLSIALTSLVMLIAFTAIYGITAGGLRLEAHRKLNDMGRLGFSAYAQKDTLSPDYDLSFMLRVDEDGNLLSAYARGGYPDSQDAFEAAARFAREDDRARDFVYFNSYWRYQSFVDPDGGRCIAFWEVTSDRGELGTLLITLLFVGVAAVAVIFVCSRFFAGRVVRPIMEAWERQKRFVADASHELKTPLMTIMANCDVLEANADETVGSQREWLESIKLGADRMGRLVGHMLTLARAEGMERREEKRRFDLGALIGETVRSMDAAAGAKNLQVHIADVPERAVCGYGDAVRQVFAALYENAVKYTDEGGTVEVSVRLQRGQAEITLRNTGVGIPPEHLPHIFDRFYRADAVRSAENNSYGLGLAIARATAERIGGNLTASSAPGEWTAFTFCF